MHLFEKADVDNTGRVSYEEFKKLMQSDAIHRKWKINFQPLSKKTSIK